MRSDTKLFLIREEESCWYERAEDKHKSWKFFRITDNEAVERLQSGDRVKIFLWDNSSFHTMSLEHPRALSWTDYLRWYWKKQKTFKKAFPYTLIKPLWKTKGLLMAGVKPSFTGIPFLEGKEILVERYSYFLSLTSAFLHKLKAHHAPSFPLLMVWINIEQQTTFLLLVKEEPFFIRHCPPPTQHPTTLYFHTIVLDTLRHLEKNVNIVAPEIVFFSECSVSGLEVSFPQATFFQETQDSSQEINVSDSRIGSWFHRLLLSQEKKLFAFPLLKQFSFKRGSLSRILPITTGLWTFGILGIVGYQWVQLHWTKRTYVLLKKEVEMIEKEREGIGMPLSQKQQLEAFQLEGKTLHAQLWIYLQGLEKIFKNRALLQDLLIDKTKAVLTIQSQKMAEVFAEWQQHLPMESLTHKPSQYNTHVLTTPSPLGTLVLKKRV